MKPEEAVEVAVVFPVRLRYVACMPAAKVEVAVVEVALINGTLRYCHADMPRARISPEKVVVALLVKLVAPVTVRPEVVTVPVAVRLARERSPEMIPLPWTERVREGVEEPRPSLPLASTMNTVDVANP